MLYLPPLLSVLCLCVCLAILLCCVVCVCVSVFLFLCSTSTAVCLVASCNQGYCQNQLGLLSPRCRRFPQLQKTIANPDTPKLPVQREEICCYLVLLSTKAEHFPNDHDNISQLFSQGTIVTGIKVSKKYWNTFFSLILNLLILPHLIKPAWLQKKLYFWKVALLCSK